MNKELQSQLEELLFLALEHEITEEQIQTLNSLIKNNSEMIRYTVNYLQISSVLKGSKTVADMTKDDVCDCIGDKELNESLMELAKYEKTAPVVDVSDEKQFAMLIQKVEREKASYKFSKANVFSIIISVAAILFIVAFLHFAPDRSSIEVATVIDKMDVKFANSGISFDQDSRIYSSDRVSLSKGLLEIQTDRGVTLTIEGPAEFEFTKEADVSLHYGRVYASVSPQGIGFVINTPNSKIIDLGTEFGVKADLDGQTELHVMKGKTTLVTGGTWLDKNSETVLQEQARRISIDGTQVKEIPIQENVFVREINSENKTIFRGSMKIDLPDSLGNTGKYDIVHPLGVAISGDPAVYLAATMRFSNPNGRLAAKSIFNIIGPGNNHRGMIDSLAMGKLTMSSKLGVIYDRDVSNYASSDYDILLDTPILLIMKVNQVTGEVSVYINPNRTGPEPEVADITWTVPCEEIDRIYYRGGVAQGNQRQTQTNIVDYTDVAVYCGGNNPFNSDKSQ